MTRPYWETWKTPPEIVEKVDHLLDSHTDRQIAEKLNEQGLRSGKGHTFHSRMIASLRIKYGLKSRYARLREAGLLTAIEMARKLKVTTNTINAWKKYGLVRGYVYNNKNECLFEPPGENPPAKIQGRKISKRLQFSKVFSDGTKEVQYEA